MTAVRLDELTYQGIAELIRSGHTNLLWPVGTLEAHGRHAPVGTDNFCAEHIALRLSEILGWPVAPTLNYGITTGLVAYPGGVRINRNLYTSLVKNILENYLEMGFRRIAIVNGHGGNTEALAAAVKDLIVRERGNRHLIVIDWWQLDGEALEEVYGRPGGHAALDETACILAFRPELVKEQYAAGELQTRFRKGVVSLPYPAAVITYEEGDAFPDFDREKALRFTSKVLERIAKVIKEEVETFERSFRGIQKE